MFERDGLLQVMGKGTVTIVDPGEMSYTNHTDVGATDPISLHNLRVHILSYGDRYHLHKRSLILQDG
jgi:cyanophycinase